CEPVDVDIGNDYDNPQQDYKEEPLTNLSLYTAGIYLSSVLSIYKDMVQDYTRRELSFQDDAEDAFRRLLLALEKRFSLRTHMALPVSDFARSLNWFCLKAETWNDATQGRMQRENANGQPSAPSWTWLSGVGPISYNTIPLNNMVDIEKGLGQMPSQATDEVYELPVTGYVLDNGDNASLAGQAYILPLAYDRPIQENELIATALIVEVFHYSYITLSPLALNNQVFLVRRVGVSHSVLLV
ncbi:hypothetical protein LTR70_004077, partial [Exophiala xenobiotica]